MGRTPAKTAAKKQSQDDLAQRVFKVRPRCVTRYSQTDGHYEILRIDQELQGFAIAGVAHFIWTQIDGKKSFKKLIELVLQEFEVSEARATRDAKKFIKQLERLDLIETAG